MSATDWHPYIALVVTIGAFVALQWFRNVPSDLVFLTALLVVTALGVLSPGAAFEAFANPALVTIAGLFAVTAGLRITGALDWVSYRLLGGARTERAAVGRLAAAVVTSSAFLLNTAIVAMLMPVVLVWCRRHRVAPSRLLLPLSYLSILGGVCTLIGTSTNLVSQAKLESIRSQYQTRWAARLSDVDSRESRFVSQLRPLTFFELGWVGIPCAVGGVAFLVWIGPRLLPNRTDMIEQFGEKRREYLVEMRVEADCPLVGRSVEQAGLRHLPGLFLVEIDRGGQVITPVAPEDVIQAGDRLVFTGIVTTIVDLEKIRGLVPAADDNYESDPQLRQQRHLTEVVLSRTSPLIGQTVREANFRKLYNAAVVAVHRNGVRLTNKIGNIRLEPGDTLLLQTRGEFVSVYRHSRDFYLVSPVEGDEPRLHHKMPLCVGLTVVLIVWLAATSFWPRLAGLSIGSPAVAALAIAVLMVLSRCMRMAEARNAIDLQTLITIGAALGLGRALSDSGAAELVARQLIDWVGNHPWWLLLVIYLLTVVFTEGITNNAVAAMLLPLAVTLAAQGGYNPRPFVVAVTIGASLSFMTPIGYQTNLMVMGPGGYRPSDYLRVGFPLAVLLGLINLALIPVFWPIQ
ncbi:MAG: sodium:sulfate symporter [Pirellulaceae bacterium]|nr:MAG: sodium:sulfate symporter [Pirellulaceae bacterium]